MVAAAASPTIATPPGSGGALAGLIAGQPVPAALARLGAWAGAALDQPIRLGGTLLVTRHAHVAEALARDLEFRIAPVNAGRMDEVNGAFVLGMDRGVTLADERKALYAALHAIDMDTLRNAAAADAEQRILAAGTAIDAVEGYARPVASGTAQRLFGVGGSDATTFLDAARAIFAHVFLNVGGDQAVRARALEAATLMRGWLDAEVARRRSGGNAGTDMMGALLAGGADPGLVQRTLGGMLVGSIDTTASAVAKIVAVLGRDPALAKRVAADVDDPPRLAGWCREALRRWPHNPILVRQVACDTSLNGTAVRAGDRVVLWTQAAMLDASAFPDPGRLRPDRPAAAYLHFGGGLHPCAGRAVNAWQLPLLVGALVRRGIRKVGKPEWAGPFPAHLRVTFER